MTTAALSIDQELKDEGYDPSDDDFYEEIDSRLRSRYPQRFQATPTQEPENPPIKDPAQPSKEAEPETKKGDFNTTH